MIQFGPEYTTTTRSFVSPRNPFLRRAKVLTLQGLTVRYVSQCSAIDPQ